MVDVLKGTDTLQQVTDVGNGTTNEINVLNTVDNTFKVINLTRSGANGGSGQLNVKSATNVNIVRLAGNDFSYINSASALALGSSTLDTTAQMSMTSTSRGLLTPRMTTAQKNAIAAPAEGLEVYDLTLHKKCVYTGAAWETITSL